jgi:hypothetical protein
MLIRKRDCFQEVEQQSYSFVMDKALCTEMVFDGDVPYEEKQVSKSKTGRISGVERNMRKGLQWRGGSSSGRVISGIITRGTTKGFFTLSCLFLFLENTGRTIFRQVTVEIILFL